MHFALSRQHLKRFLLLLPMLAHGTALAHNDFDVLVFTASNGISHASTPAGIAAIQELATEHHFRVTTASTAESFINALPSQEVVVFLNTSGDILTTAQETAFKSWYQAGGGFVGIHAAIEAEPAWPWYAQLLGAVASTKSAVTTARVEFLDQVHPITEVTNPDTTTRTLEWNIAEEWYNFATTPRGGVHVLATVDEKSYSGGTLGADHPIIWCREFEGGRSAYLAMGNESATFTSAVFRGVLTNSLEWAAGELGGDSGATIHGNFEKVVLDDNVVAPMSLDVASDGKIYLVERTGAVKMHNQASGITSTIGVLNEYSAGEYGVMGIALAPDFATSKHLYIMWSPNPATSVNTRVSRFTLDTAGNLNLSSEAIVLEFFTNRPSNNPGLGHHQAGCIRFDTSGNLIIATGDNADHSSYSARNDTNIAEDARKSSANTNDLRGKFLRITPEIGGGPSAHPNYTIPSGNLFPPGTPLARPEIYAMGARNPFRFCIDPLTGWIYWGEVGPDAGNDGTAPFTGPKGHDAFNQIKQPAFYGWPYFCADNKPYLDGTGKGWTMTTLRTDLTNYFKLPSFVNGGAPAGNPALIPDPQPAWIWYPYGGSPPQFSDINVASGRCAMGGAVYQYTPGKNFPAYHDRTVFLMEWSRNDIYEVKVKPDGSILEISDFAPHLTFSRPMDMVFGPDGVMYLIEWGAGFGSGDSTDTALVKVQYKQASLTPVAVAKASVTSGGNPLTVQFTSTGSFDPDGGTLSYAWDFDGNGTIDSTAPNPSFTYTTAGTYTAVLTVTDAQGLFSRQTFTISSGNHAPVVKFNTPLNYDFFDWGDQVPFSISVTDSEDGSTASGTITAAQVTFEGSLGHDDHKHNETQINGLSGTVVTRREASHPFDADLAYVLDAFYTDKGATGVAPIQGSATAVLQPKVTMAQSYDSANGVTTAATADAVGGVQDVISIDHGDFISFSGLNLQNVKTLLLRAASASAGGVVTVRQDSPTGNIVATVNVVPTGSDSKYLDFAAPVSNALPGSHDLYFVFTKAPGATNLMRLNWVVFRGAGATLTPQLPLVTQVSTSAADTLLVQFDQAMDLTALGTASNYSLGTGNSIVSASPTADQTGVLLKCSGLVAGASYTLSLTGMTDLAGDPIAPETKKTFVYSLPKQPVFVLGLNSGGPDYTDSKGNLYIADTTPTTSGGSYLATPTYTYTVTNPISGTPDPQLYQTERWYPGSFSYAIPVPNGLYQVVLRFAEVFYTADGSRILNVKIEGGSNVFNPDLDIHAVAGPNTAFDHTVSNIAVNDGVLNLDFVNAGSDNPKVSAVGIFRLDSAPPSGDTGVTVFAVNSGGTAAGDFAADSSFAGGFPFTSTASITSAGTVPQTVYQSERAGNFAYTVTGLDPAADHTVDLHFAELFWTSPGQRLFDVLINGSQVLNDFDIFAAAGGSNTAVVKSFTLKPDSAGTVLIQFVTVADNASLSGLAIKKLVSGPDADGDGVPDNVDAFPNNPAEWEDSDNDGIGNNSDPFPNDPTNGATPVQLIVNGSFENTTPKSTGSIKIAEGTAVTGWFTNNPSNNIEIWKSGFLNFPSQDGEQHVEMDGFSVEQTFATTPGATLNWSFHHRGRGGNGTVAIDIGPASAPVRVQTYTTGTTAWVKYEGAYVVPSGQTQTKFAIIHLTGALGKDSNLIDNVSVLQAGVVNNDSDGDGVPNSQDAFPNDPTESADTDNDGVGNNSDAFPNDPTEWADTDKDGIGNNSDPFPNDPTNGATPVQLIVNGSFENTTPKSTGSIKIAEGTAVPGWFTNNPSNNIEIWQSGFLSFPAQDGVQFVEMDGFSVEQTFATTPGATLNWSFHHRGRGGNGTVAVDIGPASAPVRVQTYTTGTTAWVKYEGTYVVPAGQTQTKFAIVHLTGALGKDSNLIDNVSVLQSATTTGGTATLLNGSFEQDLQNWTGSNIAVLSTGAYLGTKALDLQAGSIEQTITGLKPGTVHTIYITYKSQSGITGTLADAIVSINGAQIGEIHNLSSSYVEFNGFEFVPTGTTATLKIQSLETGLKGLIIDGLRLENAPLPEPPASPALVNGSFEDQTGLSGTNPHISGFQLPGWLVTQENVDPLNTVAFGWTSVDGIWVLDLGGHGPGGIAQTVTGLTPGSIHTLSFSYARHIYWGQEPVLKAEVYANGALLATLSRDMSQMVPNWTSISFNIPASAEGKITVEFRSISKTVGGGIILDNVNLLPAASSAPVAKMASFSSPTEVTAADEEGTSTSTSNLTSSPSPGSDGDSDGDGVADNQDLFPSDPDSNGAGRYTLLLPVPAGVSAIGDGYGLLTLDAELQGELTLNMGDGSQFIQTVDASGGVIQINATGTAPHTADTLHGALTFNPQPGISDFSGTLRWSIEGQANPIDIVAIGSLYTRGNLVAQLGTSSLTLDLMGNSTDLQQAVSVVSKNTIRGSLAPQTGTFDPATGLLTWELTLNGKSITIEAVYFDDQNLLGGFFHDGLGEAGPVQIAP